MQLIPAIDLRGGRCVRLLHGEFAQETRYSIDPLELAQQYAKLGAEWLHVVDHDGAARGAPEHLELLRRIAGSSPLKIQFGGGVRNRDSLRAALEVADRVVIGSLTVTAPELVGEWLEEFGPARLTLGLDVRLDDGGVARIATHGWTKHSGVTLAEAIERYTPHRLEHVLCTDVAKDGALAGPNFELYAECVSRWPALAWQASGGVRDAADLRQLAGLGVAGAISGKALLERRLAAEEIRSFLPNA